MHPSEDKMKAVSLATKLQAKDAISFWSEAKKLSGSKRGLPQTVDGQSGVDTIAELRKSKYSY